MSFQIRRNKPCLAQALRETAKKAGIRKSIPRVAQDNHAVEREPTGPDVLILRGDTLDGTNRKFLILKRDTL